MYCYHPRTMLEVLAWETFSLGTIHLISSHPSHLCPAAVSVSSGLGQQQSAISVLHGMGFLHRSHPSAEREIGRSPWSHPFGSSTRLLPCAFVSPSTEILQGLRPCPRFPISPRQQQTIDSQHKFNTITSILPSRAKPTPTVIVSPHLCTTVMSQTSTATQNVPLVPSAPPSAWPTFFAALPDCPEPSSAPVRFGASVVLGNCLAQLLSTGGQVVQGSTRQAGRQDSCGVTQVFHLFSRRSQQPVPAPVPAARDSLATPKHGISPQSHPNRHGNLVGSSCVSISSPTTTCPANCPVNNFATCRSCSFVSSDHRVLAFFRLLMSPTGRGNFISPELRTALPTRQACLPMPTFLHHLTQQPKFYPQNMIAALLLDDTLLIAEGHSTAQRRCYLLTPQQWRFIAESAF